MTCLGPIPEHLRAYSWYASHQAHLRDLGLPHHDPGDALPERATLAGATLAGAILTGANLGGATLTRANLAGAILVGANLEGAILEGAILTRAILTGADLDGADLDGADLEGAILEVAILAGADLEWANLAGANLAGADLEGADISKATCPDGRPWEAYVLDPLAGICQEPEARARAIAAWLGHTWDDCPMHAALGIGDLGDIYDEDRRRRVAFFVAAHDAMLLPRPEVTQ